MPNPTMLKFGYPGNAIAETEHWAVLLRPQQPTLGALVLACKDDAQAFGALSPEAFADLQRVVAKAESMLRAFVGYERINYLMLMMVDPDVHFHVLPRYSEPRRHGETDFADAGWPGPPVLGEAVTLDSSMTADLVARLKDLWPA